MPVNKRVMVSVRLPADLVERARNAADALRSHWSMTELVERGLRDWTGRLERWGNNGKPFAARRSGQMNVAEAVKARADDHISDEQLQRLLQALEETT